MIELTAIGEFIENDYVNGGRDVLVYYGDSVTYYWDNTSGKESYPYYEITRGTTKLTGNLYGSHSSITYHNGKEWVTSEKPTSLTEKQEICTVIVTYYYYDASAATDLQEKSPDAYNMLFGSSDNNYYWLASTYIGSCISNVTNMSNITFGLLCVEVGRVEREGFNSMFESDGQELGWPLGVRAVVQLSPDVQLTGSSSSGWSIQ